MKTHIITENDYLRIGLTLLTEQCEHTVNIITTEDDNCLKYVGFDDLVIFHLGRLKPSLLSLMHRLNGKVKIILISSYNIKLDAIFDVLDIVSESVSVDYFLSLLMRKNEFFILINKKKPYLTLRERMVLIDILHGKSAYYISQKLGLSRKTVYSHKLSAFSKLNAKNRHDVLLLTWLMNPVFTNPLHSN